MSRLRRGHRLHSIPGFDEKDFSRFSRIDHNLTKYKLENESRIENEFLEYIRNNDFSSMETFAQDPTKTVTVSQNWDFVRLCVNKVVESGDTKLLRCVLLVMTDTNPDSYDVGEYFILETIGNGNPSLVITVLEYWMLNRSVRATSLDVIHTALNYAAQKTLKETEALNLLQTTIYCATVDKKTKILKEVLNFYEEKIETLGPISKLNADCMIHAVLEEDKERVAILYSYGYRLGMDTDRRINKDYLKRIKLFKARASPVYNIVVFETTNDIYMDDPLKKSFEYARQACRLANKIQDFNKEYNDIAKKM
ncbi:uncharacterized protein [Lepeophtheirus salmonis]|uniref:uncharacterized protein isoform X1 n=1 Tax=Lepeophtheirus salmonis TaxID=72036 RepID=UPI001AE604FD|nr:uncharacterized protein LOC121113661 [Lepeophtheirus salmonis]